MRRWMLLLAIAGCAEVDPTDAVDPTDPVGPSGCTADHELVGGTGTLITRQHGASGTVTVVDDCTLTITRFTYDGTGLDVRATGAIDSAWGDGFYLSDDLLRRGGYDNETLTLTLPESKTLSDMNGLSIWCLDADISFADVQL